MKIYVLPFQMRNVKYEGAASSDEFRGWVEKYGDRFYYTLRALNKGDIIVYAWIENKKYWTLIGDGIVQDNHETGINWCDCESKSESGYERHLIVGGVRLFPKNVKSSEFKFNSRRKRFIVLSEVEYIEILNRTVSHW